jgi:hypothetical protein
MVTSTRVCPPGRGLLKRTSPLVMTSPSSTVFQPMPRDGFISVVLGLELDALAQRTLHPPVARILAGQPDFIDVGHKVIDVLEM